MKFIETYHPTLNCSFTYFVIRRLFFFYLYIYLVHHNLIRCYNNYLNIVIIYAFKIQFLYRF